MKNYLFAAMLAIAGCTQPKPSAETPGEPYKIVISEFGKYNPSSSAKTMPLPESLKAYAEHGLDMDEIGGKDGDSVTNPEKFRELVYKEAEKHGYSRERISRLSPKETIQLTCDIIADKFNFYGVAQDYKEKKRMDKAFAKREENKKELQKMLDDPKAPERAKEYARQILDEMKDTDNTLASMRLLEDALSKFGGLSTVELDSKPIDEIFEKDGEIVCRHYARLAKGIFNALKKANPGLQNTYVSCYSARVDHLWNQVITLEEGSKPIAVVSFFDPTFYDNSGSAEAVTKFHLGDQAELKEQIKKAEDSQK